MNCWSALVRLGPLWPTHLHYEHKIRSVSFRLDSLWAMKEKKIMKEIEIRAVDMKWAMIKTIMEKV